MADSRSTVAKAFCEAAAVHLARSLSGFEGAICTSRAGAARVKSASDLMLAVVERRPQSVTGVDPGPTKMPCGAFSAVTPASIARPSQPYWPCSDASSRADCQMAMLSKCERLGLG